MEYLAQVAREASNNRFKFSYAHDVLLPEVSPEVHVVPCMEVHNIPVVPCAVEVLKLAFIFRNVLIGRNVKVVGFNRTGHHGKDYTFQIIFCRQ